MTLGLLWILLLTSFLFSFLTLILVIPVENKPRGLPLISPDLGLIFNYQITNLPDYQILSEYGTVCINNRYKIFVFMCITANYFFFILLNTDS